MFISRVRLDLNRLQPQELFSIVEAQSYTAHQLLWSLFPDIPKGERPFLFRQEVEQDIDSPGRFHGLPLFYIVSSVPPQGDGFMTVETKPFEPKLKKGDRLAFKLRANPTVDRSVDRFTRSHRADVIMDAKKKFSTEERASTDCKYAMEKAAADWLVRKAATNGFECELPLEAGAYRQQTLAKKGRSPIRFSSVDYEGVLRVSDPVLFLKALSCGIGRAKGFGCGLMLIRPA